MSAPVIVWFRRDLRLGDQRALFAATQSGKPILPLFIFDPALIHSSRIGVPRLAFLLDALRVLDGALRELGGCLLIRHGEALPVLRALIMETGADRLYVNHDYTPYAHRRDAAIHTELGIAVESFHDRLIMPPESLYTATGKPYTVYTPYKKRWRAADKPDAAPLSYALRAGHLYPIDTQSTPAIPTLADLGFSGDTIPLPEASPQAAESLLARFLDGPVYDYATRRDRLADAFSDPDNGTSSLSPYIRFGLVSLRGLRAAAADAYRRAQTESARESVNTWVDELIWHEFYTQVLWHHPHALTRNFKPAYDAVQWRHDPDGLMAWQAGQTGYPVVDAAMRQLNATGWMHNRARMIVASFLTKDLLIDWREGERYFMQHLLDGDSAANNGGWQWAASTGTDAQPYFRIFNPVSQSQKFDPDGSYIRRWIPELRGITGKAIHAPWTLNNPPVAYPLPIVDHKTARERTLAAYAVVKSK